MSTPQNFDSPSISAVSATATAFQQQPSQAGPSQPRPQLSQSSSSNSPFPANLSLNLNGLPLPLPPSSQSASTNGETNGSQQDLQARLAMAQQAIQGMQQQQEQQQNGSGGEQRDSSDGMSQGTGSGFPITMANAAQAAAVLGNIPGANKEQILKQLQALQTSQHNRTRLGPQGSAGLGQSPQASTATPPSNPPLTLTPQNPSVPLSSTSPTPTAESSTMPVPQPTAQNGPGTAPSISPLQITQQQQQEFLATQQDRIRTVQAQQQAAQGSIPPRAAPPPQQLQTPQTPQAATPNPSTPSNHAQTPGNAPRPPPGRAQQMQDQRKNFVNSLAAYFRANNLTLPPEVFNGEKDGSIKVGGVWLELMDLFMTVMRAQGFQNASKQPAESPLWQTLLTSRGIPNPLPEPATLPRASNSTDPPPPPEVTTDPVQFLIATYKAYLHGFEQHMHKQRQMAVERQARMNAAAGKVPPSGSTANPTPATPTNANGVSSPATPIGNAFTPGPIAAPTSTPASTVATSLPTDSSPTVGVPGSVPPPQTPQANASVPSPNAAPTLLPPINSKKTSRDGKIRPIPGPISTDGSPDPSAPVSALPQPGSAINASANSIPTLPPAKRKRGSKPNSAEVSAQSSPVKDVVALPAETPPSPKRARYKVEYRPLHLPYPSLAGWDERAVASTFPKNNLSHPSRLIHELGIVDMEAVLMGLRSRLPNELGYSLTVLSMLSMPHPEERIGGLPLQHLSEVYLELLELLQEAVFGEDGYEKWEEKVQAEKSDKSDNAKSIDIENMTFVELERLGQNFDFTVMDESELGGTRNDRSGGSTEIALTILNLFRNLSMLKENEVIMARRPLLFVVLSRITDSRLARLPGSRSDAPFSILELARVRRDAVVILTNIGSYINLSSVPFPSILSIFRLLSTYLSSGFESLIVKESPYGPGQSLREAPAPMVLSVYRALEAFCKLSAADANRETLGKLPPSELISLFESLIKLFPMTRRAKEAMFMIEDHLGYTECLAVSIYSLVFLSPLSVRASMRVVPGAVALFKRLIIDTMSRHFEFKDNMFAILCRRLCEILGVLNGTVSCTGEISNGANMSFSAMSGDGKGWRWASGIVEQGWLAADAERLGECLSTRGLDTHTFGELDRLWWAQD